MLFATRTGCSSGFYTLIFAITGGINGPSLPKYTSATIVYVLLCTFQTKRRAYIKLIQPTSRLNKLPKVIRHFPHLLASQKFLTQNQADAS